MNKLHRFYVVLIVLQLIVPGFTAFCFGQVRDSSLSGRVPMKIYVIQVAASKVYIDPEFFRQKFNLTEKVRHFRKNGWYKYIFGSWKTENEAIKELAGLKFKAFVSFVNENGISDGPQDGPTLKPSPADSLPEKSTGAADTAQLAKDETYSSRVIGSEWRRLYNQKIRGADSTFNIAKNLVLAKRFYQEATLIDPDKNYPKDQIIEIDKQLTQKRPQSTLSNLPLKFYIVTGFTVALILVSGIILILWILNRKQNQRT
jgi:hypothetical protein